MQPRERLWVQPGSSKTNKKQVPGLLLEKVGRFMQR